LSSMLKQFKFTIEYIVSVNDITLQDAERAYQNDPNVGCYLEEPEVLSKVIDQQKRLLDAILQHEEVLNRLVLRYIYEHIQEYLYDELKKPTELAKEIFLVIGEAIQALDFVDRALYLAYAAPQTEYETEDDGDPFEQHTRLIRGSFRIEPSRINLIEVPIDGN
jgi:hypothetical protein